MTTTFYRLCSNCRSLPAGANSLARRTCGRACTRANGGRYFRLPLWLRRGVVGRVGVESVAESQKRASGWAEQNQLVNLDRRDIE